MAKAINDKIQTIIDNQQQIHIEFKAYIGESINGYPLAICDDLLLIQYLDDFRIDGYRIVRINDISAIRSNKLERFFEKILESEETLKQISLPSNIDISSWKALFQELRMTDEIFIIECYDAESGDIPFYIGKINRLNPKSVSFRSFDATAVWNEPVSIPYENIVNVQFKSHYIEIFSKYL